jgi:hypothetical protein
MDGQHGGNRLHFDEDVVHEKIEPELAVEPRALVDNWDTTFSRSGQLSRRQFVTQTLRVDRLQKARSELAMNFDGCGDDFAGEIVGREPGEHAPVVSKPCAVR